MPQGQGNCLDLRQTGDRSTGQLMQLFGLHFFDLLELAKAASGAFLQLTTIVVQDAYEIYVA